MPRAKSRGFDQWCLALDASERATSTLGQAGLACWSLATDDWEGPAGGASPGFVAVAVSGLRCRQRGLGPAVREARSPGERHTHG